MFKRIGTVLGPLSRQVCTVASHTDNQALSKTLQKTFSDNKGCRRLGRKMLAGIGHRRDVAGANQSGQFWPTPDLSLPTQPNRVARKTAASNWSLCKDLPLHRRRGKQLRSEIVRRTCSPILPGRPYDSGLQLATTRLHRGDRLPGSGQNLVVSQSQFLAIRFSD